MVNRVSPIVDALDFLTNELNLDRRGMPISEFGLHPRFTTIRTLNTVDEVVADVVSVNPDAKVPV